MAVLAGGGHAERFVVHERAAIPVPATAPVGAGRRHPRERHHRPRRALHPGRPHRWASGCSCTARPAAWAPPRCSSARWRAPRWWPPCATRRSEPAVEALAPGVWAIPQDGFEQHGPFDVILELVGAPNLPGDLEALATGGRISVIGVGAGAKAEVNLLALMAKRGRILASTLRARPLEQKADAARRVETNLLPALEDGRLRLPVDRTFPMAEATAAYEHFATGGKVGKVVLLV